MSAARDIQTSLPMETTNACTIPSTTRTLLKENKEVVIFEAREAGPWYPISL